MKTGIYKIINTSTNKIYVGSAVNIESRWKEHLNDLKMNKHHSIKLQRSYNKHGLNCFKFEIIEECDKKLLIKQEQHYIDSLNSFHEGYNSSPTAGSRLGSIQSEETKKKISDTLKGRPSPNKGKIASQATKDKLSKARKGKKLSLSHINNISKAKLGDKNPFYGKKVKEEHKTYKRIYQFSKSNEFIKEWKSLTECATALKTTVKRISEVLRGKRNSHLGFTFKYVTDNSTPQ
jgi:group I intron endonuclease